MTKFKKIVSGTLAGCLMASALMMSAGAANVQTTVISKAGVQAAVDPIQYRSSQIVALCMATSACDLEGK